MTQTAGETLTFQYRPNFKATLFVAVYSGLLCLVSLAIIRSGVAPRGGAIEGGTAILVYGAAAFFGVIFFGMVLNLVVSIRSKTVLTLGPDAITTPKRPGWGRLVSAPYGAITSTRTQHYKGARTYLITTADRRMFLDSSAFGGEAVYDRVVEELDRRIALARTPPGPV